MEKCKISQEFVQKILFECKKQETEENKLRHLKIINTKQNVIVVKMEDVRKIAKDVCKNDFYDYLENSSKTNIYDEYYEETIVQGIVIASQKDIDFQIKNFDWWINKIDNWSTCDTVVSSMKVLKKSKEKDKYFNYFYNLCFRGEEFVSRFGIIVLMSNYLEEKYISKILQMTVSVDSEAYYVQMALAWLLSFCFMKFRDETYKLLESKTLSKFIQNKTISKCRDSYQVPSEDKEKLKTLRK